LSTARFDDQKCLDRLIDAFDRIYPSYPNTWLFLVGMGRSRKNSKRSLQPKPAYHGSNLSAFRKMLPAFYQMADIFLSTSDNERA